MGRESTTSGKGLSWGCGRGPGGLDAVLRSATGGSGLAISPAVPRFPSLGAAKLSALLQLDQGLYASKLRCLLRQLWETATEQLAKEAKEGIK